MPIDYIKSRTARLYKESTGGSRVLDLLWGDRVSTGQTSDGRRRTTARGQDGWVDTEDLGGSSLLEVYFIDVGQGDGVLIRTPDHRHIMIDGGYKRSKQPTGKNAADFVDWKFFKDYGGTTVDLDVVIASHCDADHYGGLWDLLNPLETHELDTEAIVVGRFYHAGVSWWKKPGGVRWVGPKQGDFLTQLLGNRSTVRNGLLGTDGKELQGEWADFMQVVYDVGCPIDRLNHSFEWLPDFHPDDSDVAVRVLAPIEYDFGGSPAYKSLGGTDKNTNGHSVLLRLDYGRARILLTGDLNKKAQQLLLEELVGERQELACDVAKGCHHGADDVSIEFLQTMGPAATIISSGDNESHAHPRPKIVAASGVTGHLTTKNDEILTPLVYSTEISRSVRIGTPKKFTLSGFQDANGNDLVESDLFKVKADYEVVTAGALQPEKRDGLMAFRKVVDGVRYGLVNVRTDGNEILCATMNEKDSSWEYEVFESRF